MRRIPTLPILLLLVGALSTPLMAADLTIGAAGRVSVELIGSEAAFSNTMSISSPAAGIFTTGCLLQPAVGLPGVHLLSEKLSQRGCRVTLDADTVTDGVQGFAAGTVFNFRFCAQTDADADCEFVWSSNPGDNTDMFDHVATTELYPVAYPGQVYQLAWEDLENGGDMDFNDLIAVVRVEQDSDGDGLWDDWEQFGVDTDGNGTIDLDLPTLGADPQHKDLFIELDWMDCAVAGSDCAAGDTHTHQPKAAAVSAMIAAFAAAPVANPDGVNGINLVIDVSNSIPHENTFNMGLCFAKGAGIGDFDATKADPANFGPTNPRRYAFHYGVMAHRLAAGRSVSGCGELPGNDFIVAFGGWGTGLGDQDGDGSDDEDIGTVQQQAGTIMHEFGHNLNLQHGGDESLRNRKPNYMSIMNYEFQTRGISPTDPDGGAAMVARIDYSTDDLPDLNENALDETLGVQDGAVDNTRYRCADFSRTQGPAQGAIDWNCDTDSTDNPTVANINGDCTDDDMNNRCNGADTPIFSLLTGFDDWDNILYAFHATADFDDGDHSDSQIPAEINYPTDACQPVPLGQGYWHRQCLGAGMISPGRNGRGPTTVPEPDFVKTLVPAVDLRLQNSIFEFRTCEDGIDTIPPSDKCEKAIKQYTSLLLNVESDRLHPACGTDVMAEGCSSTNLGDLLGEIAGLINSGDDGSCKIAQSCADTINSDRGLFIPDESSSAAVAPSSLGAPLSVNPLSGDIHSTSSVTVDSPAAATTGGGGGMSVSGSLKKNDPVQDVAADASPSQASPEVTGYAVTALGDADAGAAEGRRTTLDAAPRPEANDFARQIAILKDRSAALDARAEAENTLFTALGGGYPVAARLHIATALVDTVDAGLHSLLARHLEDIAAEAGELGDDKLAAQAERLIKKMEPAN